MSTVLVTGANGFIGRHLCAGLLAEGRLVRGAVRSLKPGVGLHNKIEFVEMGSIGPDTDWSKALADVDTVIHLAGRVHVMKDTVVDPLAEHRYVNVAATKKLAEMSLRAGVHKFIYLSSIKVNGERTQNKAFTEDDIPSPKDHYGVSKWEAEQALQQVANGSDLEVVIIRSPLVYGPGVGGNFLRLMSWVDRGIPLPFNSIQNKRSLIGIDNLVDLITNCIANPNAANETFVASDGEDLSTPELIRCLALQLGRSPRLFSLPRGFIRATTRVLGRQEDLDRLYGSLVVDSGKAKRLLGWIPKLSLDEGLKQMANWYLSNYVKKNV